MSGGAERGALVTGLVLASAGVWWLTGMALDLAGTGDFPIVAQFVAIIAFLTLAERVLEKWPNK